MQYQSLCNCFHYEYVSWSFLQPPLHVDSDTIIVDKLVLLKVVLMRTRRVSNPDPSRFDKNRTNQPKIWRHLSPTPPHTRAHTKSPTSRALLILLDTHAHLAFAALAYSVQTAARISLAIQQRPSNHAATPPHCSRQEAGGPPRWWRSQETSAYAVQGEML